MTPEQLKASILQYAIQGKLVEQRPEEGTAEELYQQIQAEKQRFIKKKKIKKDKPLPEITDDEKPFDIPDSWKWVRFSSVINLQSGQDMTPDKYNTLGEGVPYITGASNIDNGTIIINRWTNCGKAFAYKGDLLLTCKGTVGAMAILQEPQSHIARQIMAIRPIGSIYTSFIQIVLETLVKALKAAAKSMIPGIARDDILTSMLPLPPLAEQKRIVAKIEELLPLIDRYAVAYEKLKQFNAMFPEDMKKSILQYAIQGKLVEQRPEEGTGEELYRQIQEEKQRLIKEGKIKKEKLLPEITDDEKPFDIPDSWKWVRLGNLITVRGGKRLPAGENLITDVTDHVYIRVTDMKNDTVDLSDLHYITDSLHEKIKNYIITKEDVYIVIVGSTIGKVGIIPDVLDFMNLTENAARLTPYFVHKKYLLYALKTSFLQDQFFEKTNQVGQPKLALIRLKTAFIPLPPLAEQKRIVAKIEELLPLCERLK